MVKSDDQDIKYAKSEVFTRCGGGYSVPAVNIKTHIVLVCATVTTRFGWDRRMFYEVTCKLFVDGSLLCTVAVKSLLSYVSHVFNFCERFFKIILFIKVPADHHYLVSNETIPSTICTRATVAARLRLWWRGSRRARWIKGEIYYILF